MSAISIPEILKYLNEARERPQNFIKYVQEDIDSFIDNYSMPLKPGCNYQVNESKKAWLECKNFLQEQKPLHPFKLSDSLVETAKDHCIDMKKNNLFGHTGSDGSDLSTRIKRRCGTRGMGLVAENIGSDFLVKGRNHALKTVLGLIVDDGVPSRGHRRNIFSKEIGYIGLYSAVQGDKVITVMNFHSENLPLNDSFGLNKGKENMKEEINYDNEEIPKPKGFGNFGRFMNGMEKGTISSKPKGGKFAVSKSTSTSSSISNGTKIVKIVE